MLSANLAYCFFMVLLVIFEEFEEICYEKSKTNHHGHST